MSSRRAESVQPDEGTHSAESVREPRRTPPEQPSEGRESAAAVDPAAEQARAFAQIAELLGCVARPARAEKLVLERLSKRKTRTFTGSKDEDPEKAEDWLEDMSRVLDEIHCAVEEKVECMVSLLQGDAYRWWSSLINNVRPELITWEFFQAEFRKNYVGQGFLDDKRAEFLGLKQKELSVMEYKIRFVRLSKYGPEFIPNNREKCRKFREGLNLEFRRSLLAVETEDFNKLVERALEAERLRNIDLAIKKRKFSSKDGASSAGGQSKRQNVGFTRPAQSNPGGRGRNDQPAPSVASTPSVGKQRTELQPCQICGRTHRDECRKLTGACFVCGATDHMARDCPRRRTDARTPTSGAAPT